MYKTGPVHWGELGRGSSLASGSHILWPLQTAPFTMVMGRHKQHSDTSELPFSYLIENNGASYLAPAVNLFKAGTARDFAKWPKRDGRKGGRLLDCINFNQLSPYTAGLMLKGIEVLENISKGSADGPEGSYCYKGSVIAPKALKRGIEYYKAGLSKYLGTVYTEHAPELSEAARELSSGGTSAGTGPWCDISGLLAPCSEISALLDMLADGSVSSLGQFNEEIKALHENYSAFELRWLAANAGKIFGLIGLQDIDLAAVTREQAEALRRKYEEASEAIRQAVIADAAKDVVLSGEDPDKNSFIRSLKK